MKKIVGILSAAALLATSVFAAEPAFNAAVLDFTGDASVTWGVDFDNENKTGFKNAESAKLNVKLFDGGDKVTEGSDIWAELKIKSDDGVKSDGGAFKAITAVVDCAKIHIGPVYIGIRSGDTKVAGLGLLAGVHSSNEVKTDAVGNGDYTQGIVVGYEDDNIKAEFDLRSKPELKADGSIKNQYTDDYAFAAEAQLKEGNEWVNGLYIDAGFAQDFGDTYWRAFGAQASYKFKLNDTYYIKPAFSYVSSTNVNKAPVKDTEKVDMVAGLIFGWGDEADANSGLYYCNDDNHKKITPGVAINVVLPSEDDADKNDSKPDFVATVFTGDALVENFKAYAWFSCDMTEDNADPKVTADNQMWLKGAAQYAIKADDLTFTVKAGAKYDFEVNAYYDGKKTGTADDVLEVSAGLDVAGLINNTTFTLEYVSGDLLKDPAVQGTLNFTTKIAF